MDTPSTLWRSIEHSVNTSNLLSSMVGTMNPIVQETRNNVDYLVLELNLDNKGPQI